MSGRGRMWILQGLGGGRLFRVCQFGLSMTRPSATAVEWTPPCEKKRRINAQRGYILKFYTSGVGPEERPEYEESHGTPFASHHGCFPAKNFFMKTLSSKGVKKKSGILLITKAISFGS